MAQTFKAKTLLAASGRFSHEVIAPNLIYNTGDQTINGTKTFASRPTVNGTGVLLNGEVQNISLPNTIVYTTGNQIISGNKTFINNIEVQGTGIFNALDLSNISEFNFSGTDITITSGNVTLTNRPTVNGTGVLLIGEAAQVDLSTTVRTTGDQTISGIKIFEDSINTRKIFAIDENLLISGYSSYMFGSNINIIPGKSEFVQGRLDLTAAGDLIQGNINLKGNIDVNNYGNLFSFPTAVPSGLGHKFVIYKSGLNEYNANASFKSFEVNQTGVYTLNKTPIYADDQIYISGNPVLTGDLSSYATITNLASTGSTLASSINSLSGLFTGFTGALDATFASDIQLANTGSTLDVKINTLSGYVTGANATFASITNLASTGSTLNNSIISLSGLFTGFTGNLDSTFASDTQLYNTGSTLDSKINSLSGNLTSTYATITNLASTGSTLDTKIDSLSGYSASINNLQSTGSTLDIKINSLSGNLTSTYSTITNLASTGNTLDSKINSLSGYSNNTFSTINNLQSTGSNLYLMLTGFSGNLDAIYASDLQLYNTGSTLDIKINSLSGNLTSTYATISNLSLTGSNLDNKVNSLSGYSASIVNLALTGSTLDIKINSLSGNLTSTYATISNLASTGSTLQTNINNLSGYINNSSSNIVYTTGNQNISGIKTFNDDVTFLPKASNENQIIQLGLNNAADRGVRIFIPSGSLSSPTAFTRAGIIQGVPHGYGIVFAGGGLTNKKGYLTSSFGVSADSLIPTGYEFATLDWTNRILSGAWKTNINIQVGDAYPVLTTGDQDISGNKTFAQTGSFNTLQITNKKISSYSYNSTNFIFGNTYINIVNSSTNITGTLPSGITSGINYYVKNLNTGILLITGSGQRTIDGFSTVNLYKNESLQLLGVNNIGYTGWVTLSADNGVS